MAPGLTTELPIHDAEAQLGGKAGGQSYPEPLKLRGVLDGFEHEDVTPLIGREFPKVNIVDDLLNASNADEMLRDVAITSGFRLPFLSLHNPLPSEPFFTLSPSSLLLPPPFLTTGLLLFLLLIITTMYVFKSRNVVSSSSAHRTT